MELLKTIKDSDLDSRMKDLPPTEPERETVRGVIFDKDIKVAIIPIPRYKCFLLPGGGIDAEETHEETLKRECAEELGIDIQIIGEIGKIVDFKNEFRQKQTNYCYFAKKLGNNKKIAEKTVYEIEIGMDGCIWVPIEEAIKMFENANPEIHIAKHMIARDLTFLKKAKEVLVKN